MSFNKIITDEQYTRINRYLKYRRIFEILLILLFLPLILFLMIIISIVIKFDLGGKIIFKQKRPGRFGNPITFYKFRTMKDLSINEKLSIQHDEMRVTKIGNFLRKHRLDELPQLYNILKGEMSIIGPRPEPFFYYEKVINEFPDYKYKYLIKPGLTGYAQVQFRHTDDIEGAKIKYEYDIYYIRNLSYKLDLQIFFYTFSVLKNGTGGR